MAYVAASNTHAPRAAAGGLFAGFKRWIAERRAFNTTYNELSALSDRELDDLGISRGDIVRIANDSIGSAAQRF